MMEIIVAVDPCRRLHLHDDREIPVHRNRIPSVGREIIERSAVIDCVERTECKLRGALCRPVPATVRSEAAIGQQRFRFDELVEKRNANLRGSYNGVGARISSLSKNRFGQ